MTLVPFLIWLALTQARPWVMRPACTDQPTPCTRESVLAIDRVSLGMESPEADEYSFLTQNLSGVIAGAVPVGWSMGVWLLGKSSLPAALAVAGTDLVVLIQTAGINGMTTELARHLAQRPRPFVYTNPAQRGKEPAHYTSFYSGHTSFSAASTIGLLLALAGRGAPAWVLIAFGVVANLLMFLTGLFRMMAGRHFLTDVLAGAMAGSAIALWVALSHRPNALALKDEPAVARALLRS